MNETKRNSNRAYWLKIIKSASDKIREPNPSCDYNFSRTEIALMAVGIAMVRERFFDQSDCSDMILRLKKKNMQKGKDLKLLKEEGNPCIGCKNHWQQGILDGSVEYTCSYSECRYGYKNTNPKEPE